MSINFNSFNSKVLLEENFDTNKMNSKIIFWFNDHLSLLGLPKILQEKYNFDIFGIFDITDKQKKFLKKQKLINFSKIWFFHDHISKTNQKPDREFLKLIDRYFVVMCQCQP